MFACIYFEEDKSISVVGDKNRDLKVYGDFLPKTKVEMLWKISQEKKTFHGTVIKVDADEKSLTEFATVLHSKIIKPHHLKEHVDLINMLLDFKSEEVGSGKRIRKQTELLRESKRQEVELSPRKKKKELKDQEKAVKKDHVPKKIRTCLTNDMNKEVTVSGIQRSSQEILDYMESSLSDQFSSELTNADLTSTGRHVVQATNVVEDCVPSTSAETFSKIPAPPPEIIAFFRATQKPNVRNYINSFLQHFDTIQDHDHHKCYEDISPSYETLPSVPASDRQRYMEPWFSTNVFHNQEFYTQGSTTGSTSANVHSSLPVQPFVVQTSQSSMSTDVPITQTRTEIEGMQSPGVSSEENMSEVSEKQAPEKDLSASASPLGKKVVKLMEKYPYEVAADELKKITRKAIREKKPGYFITMKLMPLLFNTEEMANSRGQGLKPAKAGDIRPVLDAGKLKAIKDYAEAYARKHQIPPTSDTDLNNAVTEAIGYARKKMKKMLVH